MFDLTDDVENSPNYTKKVKPTEVKTIPDFKKLVEEKIPKKETPKNTDTETYDYNDDPKADDKEW